MISVTILTKNSQKHIQKILNSLHPFSEVAILDTGSQDHTMGFAKEFSNVVIHESPFIGFGPCHNLISTLAKNDWILSIDSDEIPSQELIQEILNLKLDPQCIYTISRHNSYRDKFIKGCGWYPDRVARLYNKKVTKFSEALVHESIIKKDLRAIDLQGPLLHFPYNSTSDFLNKMQHYSSLFAEEYKGKRSASLFTAIAHGGAAFLKSYFLKRGILLGSQGFEISAYNGITAYYKYLKLRDANTNY
ncbi:MAG: glycosyl transferase family 2 protein [Chlamydiia bacterium]|nr:glycosyl transferase family 2 protein [Chlamydiia bacterium]